MSNHNVQECGLCIIQKANKIPAANRKQKRPIASDKANPNTAQVNRLFFKDGFLAYPIIKLPNTVPIPDPVKSQIYAFNIAQKKKFTIATGSCYQTRMHGLLCPAGTRQLRKTQKKTRQCNCWYLPDPAAPTAAAPAPMYFAA